MSWYTVHFEEVPWHATKSLPCSVCGKKLRRQRKFFQTINPYNKNADGEPKKLQEILAELKVQAAAWQAEPEVHRSCEEKG